MDVTLNKSKALSALAPPEMSQLPGQDSPPYPDVLDGVVHPLPVRNVPAFISDEIGGSTCQKDIIQLVWRTVGSMIHMLRFDDMR